MVLKNRDVVDQKHQNCRRVVRLDAIQTQKKISVAQRMAFVDLEINSVNVQDAKTTKNRNNKNCITDPKNKDFSMLSN